MTDVAPRPLAEWTDLDGKTQTEWCSQHPVIDTPPHPDKTIHHLHVLEEVACRDGRGAQVLRCSLDDSSDDTTYIAKIYDPLYYSYVDSYDDPTWRADRDYSSEAAAYEELKRVGVDGSLAPKYYGSWTFDMIPDSVTMQFIVEGGFRGSMSPQHRLDILAKAFEVNSKIDFHGYESKLPVSPQYLFWGRCPEEFEHWTPYPHCVVRGVFFGWLKSCWENSTEFDGPPESLESWDSFYEDTPEYAPPIEDEDWESDGY
ncbi:Protein kinase-like domain protein [Ceratocystis lukuohia]|uniref:Protein kinase-like domain protein n=1 Tax=Ceratocystis lukuohia TaxID=2019550 RepID=A0ABR4M9W0_9PEZI